MFRSLYHLTRVARMRREIEAKGGLPGSHSAPVAWSTLFMGCGGALALAGLLAAECRILLLIGAPVLLLGLGLAVLEAILESR